MRRSARMLARRNNDAAPRAGLDVDVRIDAALVDEPELVEPLEQRRADLGPLAYQHQRFGIPQPLGQRIDILHMIVPDPDLVARELLEAVERAKRVVIIVKNGQLHLQAPLSPSRGDTCHDGRCPRQRTDVRRLSSRFPCTRSMYGPWRSK